MKQKKVTFADIAAYTGFSKTTITLHLRKLLLFLPQPLPLWVSFRRCGCKEAPRGGILQPVKYPLSFAPLKALPK